MSRKAQIISGFLVLSLLGVILTRILNFQDIQDPPVTHVVPDPIGRLFDDACLAYEDQQYDEGIRKFQDLLKAVGEEMEGPHELIHFKIGLGYLLDEKPAKAEESFAECLTKYPEGEYASRCHLGVGRAAMLQETPEKMQRAVEALTIAAKDPGVRSEACLWMGEIYTTLNQNENALKIFRSLVGSEIRTPRQTTAAVEVIGLLAKIGNLDDLVLYLDWLTDQPGVRDALAWYANQAIVKGDDLVEQKAYAPALEIYLSIPSRSEILEIQKRALESQKKEMEILEGQVASKKGKPLNQRTSAPERLGNLKPAVGLSTVALAKIEENPGLDAALLMRRGRCLYYLDRFEEALVCFRTTRTKYGTSDDAEKAAYAEIIVCNQLKDIAKLDELCNAYLTKYPDADNAEQVATYAGEVIVQSGDWEKVRTFYTGLIKDFPKSENMDRFKFFLGLAYFMEEDFKQSNPIFDAFVRDYPKSELIENVLYYSAMSKFLSNDYKATLSNINEYLAKFPNGRFEGDLRYRQAFIDFNDKEVDQSDKLIRDISEFLAQHPADTSAGSMYCLIGDTYKRKKSDNRDEQASFQKLAIDAYTEAALLNDGPDDVVQYALDSAYSILAGNKDWAGIANLRSRFLKEKPDSPIARKMKKGN